MAENQVLDWITDANTCFLMGAGCSVTAGKPLIDDLTERIVKQLKPPATVLFKNLEGINGRPPTIEDLLNQCLQIKNLITSRKVKKDADWTLEKCVEVINSILCQIVDEVGGDWACSGIHERFLRRIASHTQRKTCDIFSLNYDVVLEATLESLRFPYTDGFSGAENAHFEASLFMGEQRRTPFFRLYKLHGSVNWFRDPDQCVRRRPYKKGEPGDRLVIYPCEQKYYQTQYGVYEVLLTRFRERLRESRPNNKLVILGCSLADEHITEAILDSLSAPGNNLTVYALVGPGNDVQAQIARFQDLVDRSDNRLNVMVGHEAFLGRALEDKEWSALKNADYWVFDNLVNALTGGKA